jgi:diguanylate cyclase (GGDEF)-like protein
LYNREKLDAELEDWVERANNHSFPLALAFMDLDGFKQVNDEHGHPAGDAILKSTAVLLSKQVRESDTLARYGGDEFVLLLGGERKVDALVVCHRILKAFESATHAADGQVVDVHISIGLATLDMTTESTAEELVKAADTALLSAKAAGKGRVVAFDEIESIS